MENINDNSQIPTSTANTSTLKTSKPIYWKQVLMPEVALFIGVTVVASLLVFPVMPLVTKFLGPWLYKK